MSKMKLQRRHADLRPHVSTGSLEQQKVDRAYNHTQRLDAELSRVVQSVSACKLSLCSQIFLGL